jgi:NADP-dependent 3-hydroxy acid dehydrogenase YdfG
VALVTGASSGIGQGVALALAAEGATVAVVARRAERLSELVGRIEAAGGSAVAIAGDVTDEAFATGLVEDVARRFGRLDILVNGAGVIQAGGVENADLPEWRRVIEINIMANLYMCRAAIGVMKPRGAGDIVNITSTSGRRSSGGFGPYCTSKFGLWAMTEGMRQEVGKAGIRVCNIEPGATSTEIANNITDPNIRTAIDAYSQRDESLKPEDIAAAVVFVVSLPPRANVSEILIRPVTDVAPL